MSSFLDKNKTGNKGPQDLQATPQDLQATSQDVLEASKQPNLNTQTDLKAKFLELRTSPSKNPNSGVERRERILAELMDGDPSTRGGNDVRATDLGNPSKLHRNETNGGSQSKTSVSQRRAMMFLLLILWELMTSLNKGLKLSWEERREEEVVLTKEDVQIEREYWKHVLIGYLLGDSICFLLLYFNENGRI
ncbi:hypothetical protein Droror1_Dr00012368 [Drosera rotundifolia]